MFVKCPEKGNTFEILRPWGAKQNRLCSLKIESRFMINVNMQYGSSRVQDDLIWKANKEFYLILNTQCKYKFNVNVN